MRSISIQKIPDPNFSLEVKWTRNRSLAEKLFFFCQIPSIKFVYDSVRFFPQITCKLSCPGEFVRMANFPEPSYRSVSNTNDTRGSWWNFHRVVFSPEIRKHVRSSNKFVSPSRISRKFKDRNFYEKQYANEEAMCNLTGSKIYDGEKQSPG